MQFGRREAIKVALAPLFSDLPVVLLSVFVLSRVASLGGVLAWISIVGGVFVGWLAYESMRTDLKPDQLKDETPRSLPKAITLNLLNPHCTSSGLQ
jgi:threonine/homoserine/homoserine lactone efflux protein